MHLPGASELLDAWESGLRQPPQHRLLTLLGAVLPERSREEIAALPVGARDSALLDLREQLFGPVFALLTRCPTCQEQLEADVATAQLRARPAPAGPPVRTVSAVGHRIRFRLPTTEDLLAISAQPDLQSARELLLQRCVVGAQDSAGQAVEPGELPEAAIAALSVKMARADPQAEVTLSFTCPACGQGFSALFDVAAFLLQDLHAWARRLLREVHSLAWAYGWAERDILALSPTRRQFYLEMIPG